MFDRNRMSCVADRIDRMKRLVSLRVSDLASGTRKASDTAGLLANALHTSHASSTRRHDRHPATRREHACRPETVSLGCPTRSPESFEHRLASISRRRWLEWQHHRLNGFRGARRGRAGIISRQQTCCCRARGRRPTDRNTTTKTPPTTCPRSARGRWGSGAPTTAAPQATPRAADDR